MDEPKSLPVDNHSHGLPQNSILVNHYVFGIRLSLDDDPVVKRFREEFCRGTDHEKVGSMADELSESVSVGDQILHEYRTQQKRSRTIRADDRCKRPLRGLNENRRSRKSGAAIIYNRLKLVMLPPVPSNDLVRRSSSWLPLPNRHDAWPKATTNSTTPG